MTNRTSVVGVDGNYCAMERLGAGLLAGSFSPGSPKWSAQRQLRIGGSEIAAVLGLSPWQSYFSLWHRKAGNIGSDEDTELMLWGRLLEEPIAQRFALRHPEFSVHHCGTYVNQDRDYQLISPDRLLFSGSGDDWEPLEIKTAYDDEEWGEEGTEDIPVHYRCQVMWALDVFQCPQGRVAVYFGGDDYREYVIRHDESDAAILRKRAEEFLRSLREGILPELDGHAATYRTVRELHPDIEPRAVDLPASVALPYLAALEDEKIVAEAKRWATAEIARILGTARRARWDGRTVAIRVPGRNGSPPYVKANPLPKKEAKEIS
jgi:putative phage-type endonuclease